MQVYLDDSIDSYRRFLRIKSLPRYQIHGRMAWFPDEYAGEIGVKAATQKTAGYEPRPGLFDYQRDIVRLAVEKKRYAIFADCGLGKTLMLLEFARHVRETVPNKPVLIVSPLMVVQQANDLERLSPGVCQCWSVLAGKFPVCDDGTRRTVSGRNAVIWKATAASR